MQESISTTRLGVLEKKLVENNLDKLQILQEIYDTIQEFMEIEYDLSGEIIIFLGKTGSGLHQCQIIAKQLPSIYLNSLLRIFAHNRSRVFQ